MLKLTKTGIGLLTKQYRSVLRKCLLLNLGLFVLASTSFLSKSVLALEEGSVTGVQSIAIGRNSNTSGDYGISLGADALVGYRDGIAIGGSAKIFGMSSVAIGAVSAVRGEQSVALGSGSIASENSVISVGHKAGDVGADNITRTSDYFRRIVNVAAGQNDNDVVILKQLNDALNYYYTKDDTNFLINQYHQMLYGSSGFAFNPNTGKVTTLINKDYHAQSIQRNGNYTKSYIKDIDGHEYLNEDVTILDNIRYIDLAIGRVNAGHYVGAYSVNFNNNGGVTSINNTISDNINALDNALYNYYYTKTEADARYALLDTIGDVDYSDEAADEGSALKNGEEDSPTTVRGALDLLDTKIGSLNETGIAGDDVATQLKYILENGSTGGAGVSLSTLGYIGANTPYLNTTNNAMNFSSTYTIGGNLSTLANQIKTNETNIDNLSSRINSLSSYSGTLDLTDNYAKVIGDVNLATNETALVNDGINTKAYATPNKSYTVEIDTGAMNASGANRLFRIQVDALSQEDAVTKAKEIIINSWSDYTVDQGDYYRNINKYMYGTVGTSIPLGAYGIGDQNAINEAVMSAEATVTENNYTVRIVGTDNRIYDADVEASSASEAIDKAKVYIKSGWYQLASNSWGNIYGGTGTTANIDSRNNNMENGTATPDTIEEGDAGYSLNGYSLLENVALLDSAIGDLSATGVSGASVAAQLKLLGEVGSEALGQKIGSWSTTKDSISQTLGEETKNYGYLTAFEYDSENEQYVGTVGDNLQALDSALSLTAKGLDALSHQLYNYYYTFRVDERIEVIDSASFFQKNFPTLQEVDLQSKNQTHLGAFTKCDEVCPRPSERFFLSLSQEQMLKNDASVDAGTSRHCLRQFGDVVADLLKNTAAKSLRISEFMNEEVCHA